MNLGDVLASQLSTVLSAYTQQVQTALQAYVDQFSVQWQSALHAYTRQFSEQLREAAAPAASGEGAPAPRADALTMAAAKPLEDLSKALQSTLQAMVEQLSQGLAQTALVHESVKTTDKPAEAD